jgi:hypothetical protein
MTQVINQHYVPQSYLKNFSSDRTRIFVFDKFKQRNFKTNVRNVASERAFYDFPQSIDQPEDVQVIERVFSELEARQGRFYDIFSAKSMVFSTFDLISLRWVKFMILRC